MREVMPRVADRIGEPVTSESAVTL
jgi:hypothetical protein